MSKNSPCLPTLLKHVEAMYSEEARKIRLNGQVILSVRLNPEGRPTDIRVETPLGFGLDEEAIKAASQWEFSKPKPECTQLRFKLAFNFKLI